MLFRALLLAGFISCTLLNAAAQTPVRPQNPNDASGADKAKPGSASEPSPIGSPEQEMLARQNIKAAEKDFKENLERAREAAQLGAELRDSFLSNKSLGRGELRKLDRLEKITRKIRSEAGGSNGDVTIDDPPAQIEPALSRLAESSDKLRKSVEKTSRYVISAAVIEQANEVLEIVRYIRGFTHSN